MYLGSSPPFVPIEVSICDLSVPRLLSILGWVLPETQDFSAQGAFGLTFEGPVLLLALAATSIAGLLGLALALYNRRPAAGLFAWAFLLLPLMYYFVTAHARFRHPLEPLIAILGVYLFQSAEKSWRVWPWRG